MRSISKYSFRKSFNPFLIINRLYTHRSLIWQFTKRNIDLKHKGSVLGVFWLVLNPLMQMAIYSFVFGVIFGGRYQGTGSQDQLTYALGIFLSLTIFQLVADTMSSAPGLIVGNPNFVKKIVFPIEVLPVATFGASFYHFTISLILAIIGVLTIGNGLQWQVLYFPIILFPLILMALGLGWLISSLGVFFRDIQQAIGPIVLILMYSSAIFYSAEMVREHTSFWMVLKFNPLIHVIDQARMIFLGNFEANWKALAYVYGVSSFTCLFGFACFEKLKSIYADVL